MKQTTKRLSSTIIALVFIIAAFVVFFDLIEPEYATVQDLRGQAESEQNLLTTEQQLVKQVQGTVSTYQNQSAQVQEVSLAMPVGQDSAEAITQIYGIAASSGMSIQNLAISTQATSASTPIIASAGGAMANTLGSAIAIVKPKGTLTLQVTGIGSYGALKTFLQGVENNVRVFDVTGIGINPVASLGGPAGSAPTQDLFTYTITVVAYYQSS